MGLSNAGLPVSVVISFHPIPGKQEALTQWARGISAAAHDFPGHLGAHVYPPSEVQSGDLIIAFSFDGADALSTWEHSDVRRSWLAKLDDLVEGEATTHAVSGFEGIFAHRPGQPVVPPPRWKTAVIIALALYPMSLLLNWALNPHISGWNTWLRVLVNVVIIVPYMAWVGVPYLTRWLRTWLH